MNSPNIKISGLVWLDYVLAGPRRAVKLVKAHKKRYLDPASMAWSGYEKLFGAMRQCLNSPDPQATMQGAVAWADARQDWRGPVYRQAADGFLALVAKLPGRRPTGVKVQQPQWIEGGLTVTVRNLLGIRLSNGKLLLVAPYCKEPELDQESADILLYILESVVDQALPGATPVLWDLRRGKAFTLHARANRPELDVAVRGLVAKYLTEWDLAA
ncbi:hypothetical protein PV646_02955 [Streptomyces sp. ID05-26A]|nr:hypothetical protein [Streptomyces sp. ID05-26A]